MPSEKEIREYLRSVGREEADMGLAREALIQRENHAKLIQAFNEVDTDRSGMISLPELTKLLEKSFPEYPDWTRENWAGVIMRTCDTNNDGQISLKEYLNSKYRELLYEGGQIDNSEWNRRLKEAFQEIDTDGSNLIDAYELVELINKIFPEETEEAKKRYYKKILEDCDGNGDGLIALDEFLRCNFAHALVVRERVPKRHQFLVRTGANLGAPTPTKRRGTPLTPQQMMGTKADRREAVTSSPTPFRSGYKGSSSSQPMHNSIMHSNINGSSSVNRMSCASNGNHVTSIFGTTTGTVSMGSIATFSSSASAKSNIDTVIDNLKFTMEDFTKWNRSDVQKFVLDLSDGCSLLQKDLDRNLYALSEVDGSMLYGMSKEDLETFGVTYKCVHLFVDALRKLETNEKTNTKKREKAQKLKEAFLVSDVDNSGFIEKDEIRSVVMETFPDTTSALCLVYFNVLLQYCDPNKTGNIDLHALMHSDHDQIMMKVMSEAEKAEIVQIAFNALDEDGSGVLERPELETLINISFPEAGPTVRRKYYNAILDHVDVDNSGTVTLEEIFQSDLVKLMTELPIVTSDDPNYHAPKWRSVNARCIPTSPRRKEPVSRSFTVAHHERNEAQNFLPLTTDGQSLIDKAEQLLELDPVAHWGDAVEYFEDGSKIFQTQQEWYRAGNAMERASDCYEKLNRQLESAAALRIAGGCYQHVSSVDAAQCYKEAAELYIELKKPRMAAKEFRNIAEVYEEQGDYENAIDWYSQAADTYPSTDTQLINQCTQKVALLLANIRLLDEAYIRVLQVLQQCQEDQKSKRNCIPRDIERLFQFALMLLDLALLDTKSGIERLKGIQRAQVALNRFVEIEDTPKDVTFAITIFTCVERDAPLVDLQMVIDKYCLERVLDSFISFLLSTVRDNIVEWHRCNDIRCMEQIGKAEQRSLVLSG